jgi:polyhydroxyalkanoate synthase
MSTTDSAAPLAGRNSVKVRRARRAPAGKEPGRAARAVAPAQVKPEGSALVVERDLAAAAPADASSAPAKRDAVILATGAADLSSERLSGQFALGRYNEFLPRDLIGTARTVLQQARRKPAAVLRATAGFASDLLKIAGGESTLAPEPGDRRFTDPAWQQSWIHRGLLKSYLAFGRALQQFASNSGLDAKESERASFLMMQITEALAPTNFLLGNPVALRKVIDTGGGSLRRGGANLLGDLAAGRRLPAQSNDSGFKVGVNLAATPGAVVLRTEMFELLQYAPQTPQVRRRPTLVVPSIVNKYYAFDLAPGRSVFEYFVKQGITMFVMVWRNPKPEHDDWGMNEYHDAIDQAVDAVAEICSVADVNIWGVCGAGPVVTSLVGHYAATRKRKVTSLLLVVAPHDMGRMEEVPGIGAFADEKSVAKRVLARKQSRRISANDFSLLFGMLRPNDLIWNYWVNNYLLGNDPPTFDILTWNNDATGMTAAFNRDFGELVRINPLVTPGKMKVRGKPIADLSKLGIDSYVLGAMTDHICLWQDVYRTARMLGERSQFVLGSSGHIQTVVNPPGNPKASFFTNAAKPLSAESWLEGATKHVGSWWDHGVAWTTAHSGELVDAPAAPGSAKHPVLGKAPGTYVHEKA